MQKNGYIIVKKTHFLNEKGGQKMKGGYKNFHKIGNFIESSKKGFTLLELMIVVAIISILAMVLIPSFTAARNQAKLTSCKTAMRNISTMVENYSVDNNDKYPNLDFQVTISSPLKDYYTSIIRCPVAKDEYYYYYLSNSNSYQIYCPTSTLTLKHKTSRGIIQKLYFDPKEGAKEEY